MPGSAPRGSAVLTHQPPPSPALTPLRSGDAAPAPSGCGALRVTLLFLLRPLPSERESRAAAAALRVLRLGNLQRDRGCFVREHGAGAA